MRARPALVAAAVFLMAAARLPRARAQPSYLCQCHDLLWAPVQQADPNMTHWHDVLAAEVAQNDRLDSSQVRHVCDVLLFDGAVQLIALCTSYTLCLLLLPCLV